MIRGIEHHAVRDGDVLLLVGTTKGALRQHIHIFVGSEEIRYTGGLLTPLPDGAVITIVPAISGGLPVE